MHGRCKGVAGRARHVDIIVEMDGALRAESSAGYWDRAVGSHLVHVHAGLSARTRLPDMKWKLGIGRVGHCIIGHRFDQIGFSLDKHSSLASTFEADVFA